MRVEAIVRVAMTEWAQVSTQVEITPRIASMLVENCSEPGSGTLLMKVMQIMLDFLLLDRWVSLKSKGCSLIHKLRVAFSLMSKKVRTRRNTHKFHSRNLNVQETSLLSLISQTSQESLSVLNQSSRDSEESWKSKNCRSIILTTSNLRHASAHQCQAAWNCLRLRSLFMPRITSLSVKPAQTTNQSCLLEDQLHHLKVRNRSDLKRRFTLDLRLNSPTSQSWRTTRSTSSRRQMKR